MTPPNTDDEFDLERELDRELRRAFARIEPEKDFSALPYTRRAPVLWMRSRTILALAAAVLIALLIPAGVLRHRAGQRRAEEARGKLVTALRFTGSKLHKTREMVARGLNRRNGL
jgi:hypothetical protein